MEISYRRQGNGNCMVLEELGEEAEHNYALQMLVRNRIPGILPAEFETINGQQKLLYSIASRQTLSKWAETGRLSSEDLSRLVSDLKSCEERLGEYLLGAEQLMLRPEYIFAEPDMKRFWFCLNPFHENGLSQDIRALADQLISWVSYEDSGAVKLAYELHIIVQRDNFTIDELYELVKNRNQQENVILRSLFSSPSEHSEKRRIPLSETERERTGCSDAPVLQKQAEYLHPGRIIQTDPECRDRKKEDAGFLEHLKSYLKGKHLKDIVEDIDDGVLLQKIRRSNPSPYSKPQDPPPVPSMDQKIRRSSPYSKPQDPPPVPSMDQKIRRSSSYSKSQDPPLIRSMDLDADEDRKFWEELVTDAPSENGTVLLKQNRETGDFRLIGTGRRQGVVVRMQKFPFTIGKLRRNADYVLDENCVSRIHARIYRKEDQNSCEVEDLNSTNGTYINGVKIEPYERKQLSSGDVISFADQEYIFR